MQTAQTIDLESFGSASRILIVDDSRAQRKLLASTLRRAGYDVVEADCAEEAIPLCEDPQISVVISDWGMPGMDGPDFCRALREMERDYVYFILITSRSNREERAEGLDSGADDFVTRPIDWVELRARIRAGERIIDLHRKMAEQKDVIETTLSELQDLHAALQTDLAEARKLQQSLIPPSVETLDRCEIASRLVTCGQIGGDLVGHFKISDHMVAIYSIDVSGHGIASALMTGRLSGLFSSHQPERNIAYSLWLDGEIHLDAPHFVMERLNRLMLSELDTDIYFTCALAYLNLNTGDVELCQAGHPHPIVLRASGKVEMIGDGGPPVGLVEGMEFEKTEFTLGDKDRLLLYSDGLSEAMDKDENMLGEEGLMEMYARVVSKTSLDGLISIEEDLRVFSQAQDFDDDISMLSVQYRPKQRLGLVAG